MSDSWSKTRSKALVDVVDQGSNANVFSIWFSEKLIAIDDSGELVPHGGQFHVDRIHGLLDAIV